MNKSLYARLTPVWLGGLIGLMCLVSACKRDPQLQLQGEWQEESYWIPSDSIAADTLIHTYTLRHITFDCDGTTFRLARTTYHPLIQDDPALGTDSFTEYILGNYTTQGKSMTLEGNYYIDEDYTVVADSTNTPYSIGEYRLETTYQLDSKRLILGATTADNPTRHTFAQIVAYEDCI